MFMSVDLPAPFSPRSAWISPLRTSRSIASFASVPVGKRFVMPRISRTGGASLICSSREERADPWGPLPPGSARSISTACYTRLGDGLELAGLHVRESLLQFVLEPCRNGVEVANRRVADSVVRCIVEEVPALLSLVLEALDGIADRELQMFLGAGDDARLGVRQRLVLVDVDADAPDLRVARGAERARPGEAGHLEDDVGPLADHRLRRCLALVGSVEVTDVVHQDLHSWLCRLRGVLVTLDVVDDR